MTNTKFFNLLGQIRIYSLIDLILFVFAIKINVPKSIGVILLHLGFLLYLESVHKHQYRIAFPKYLWVVLTLSGTIFYFHAAVLGFLASSWLYTKKHVRTLGWLSPFFRGAQMYFLSAGVIGFLSPLSLFAGCLLAVRNFIGDLRDVKKDKKEGLKTLPIVLGVNQDFKYLHLSATLATSAVWSYLAGLPTVLLIPIFIVQISVYNLTPR